MARTLGTYSLSANIEPSVAAPLDARDKVPSMTELTAAGTFPYHYIGMETYVVAVNKKYRLVGDDPTVLANWEELGSGGGGTGGHTIENASGTDMTDRSNLQFKGATTVSDDSENDRTVVETPIMPSGDMSEIISPLPGPANAPELNDNSDVSISSPTNGQVLKYNSTTSKWENDDESGGGGTGGHTIEDDTGTSMTARAGLQFKGLAETSDDSANDRTVVEVPEMPSGDMSQILSPLPAPSTGTPVAANPAGTATDILNKLQVGSTIYEVKGGATVYGIHIYKNESDPDAKVAYLNDAIGMTPAHMNFTTGEFDYGSWENAFFMPKPCMLKYDGTVDYYLDPNDYTKKADGTSSDVANTSYGGNAMMEWGQNGKKIWLKIVPFGDGKEASIFVADENVDGNFTDWNFHNSAGKSVDHFYTPIYNGSLISSKLRSISGQAVMGGNTASNEYSYAQANNPSGSLIWTTETITDIDLINILLILISKSTNTQAKFGLGISSDASESIFNAFRTGVHNTKGLFYGTNDGSALTNSNVVKIFGMENWWGFQWKRYAGEIMVNGTRKRKLTYGQEDGSTTTGYNFTGNGYISTSISNISGTNGSYISEIVFSSYGIFPTVASGSSSTHYCDGLWFDNSGTRVPYRGGSPSSGLSAGGLTTYLQYVESTTGWWLGASISARPLS